MTDPRLRSCALQKSGAEIKKLDRIDYRILDALQQSGRVSIKSLSDRVGISLSPCWQRVKKLEEAGIIRGYTAKISLDKLYTVHIVFAHLILARQSRDSYNSFEKFIRTIPEVLECHQITGQFDYHIKFAVRDMTIYNQISDLILSSDIGVEKYFTYLSTQAVIEAGSPKLRDLSPESFR